MLQSRSVALDSSRHAPHLAAMASRPSPRFHGRVPSQQPCAAPGCEAAGEFRAPSGEQPTDGPPRWRWLCLDHVRAFNASYNFFDGMSPDEIADAQRPYAGWERETRAFASSGADQPPRWADFRDPMDALGARYAAYRRPPPSARFTPDEQRALRELGLTEDADLRAVRQRYSERVRRFHPDRNGGDRTHEAALTRTIDAWTTLRKARAFSREVRSGTVHASSSGLNPP